MALINAVRGCSRSALMSRGAWCAVRDFQAQALPDLPYDYGDLEPHISAEIMKLHHDKHHKTYVTTLNQTYEKYEDAEAKGDLQTMLQLQQAIRFNGGGHVNHTLFWKNLLPANAYAPPEGELQKEIESVYGSLDEFISKFNAKAAGIQGMKPLLGIDMWEHAFYLQYKNVKPDYLKQIWKVINWKEASERLKAAKSNA